jgi:hypothetical protein
MVRLIPAGLVLLLALIVPGRAAAQVALTIADGQVSLVAENATVEQILDEWARVGETQFVNADRVPGGRLTVRLDQVSENEALDVVLQSAAGFLAVAKRAPAAKSRFDRILILPTTTVGPKSAGVEPQAAALPPPEPQAAPDQPNFADPEVRRLLGPDGQPLPDDQQDRPGQPRPARPEFSPPPPVNMAPVPVSPPTPRQTAPAPQPSQPPPVSVGVPVPGMVVPVPEPNPQVR